MSKDRISATVDEEIAEFVSRDDVNASGLINNLLKQHMAAGTTEEQMLQMRRERVEDNIKDLESQLATQRERRDNIISQLEAYEQEQEQVLHEAAEALDRVDFRADNDKVAYWVGETGLSKEELRERLEEQDLL